jgi:hypothetical protein
VSRAARFCERARAIARFARCFALCALGALLAGACASEGITIENVKGSYPAVRQAVVSQLPQGVRNVSANAREFDSGYFPLDTRKFQLDASKDPERATAHVQILGASRPYTINVRVYIESRQPNGRYRRERLDHDLAEELVERVRDDLAHRREDHNIIDEFRAY